MSDLDKLISQVRFDKATGNNFVEVGVIVGAERELENIRQELREMHRLLDLRDDEYYQWWLRGLIPDGMNNNV